MIVICFRKVKNNSLLRQTLTEFIKEGQVNLKRGEPYRLTDMVVKSSCLFSG
jgi:hypothetical protein